MITKMQTKNHYSCGGFSPIAVLLAVLVLLVGGTALFVSKISPDGDEVVGREGVMMEEDEAMMGAEEGMMESSPSTDSGPSGSNNTMFNQGGMMNGGSEMGMSKTEVFVFPVTAKNYSFSPAEIRVKKGASVRIELRVEEGFHDLVLDEFNARTAQAGAGKTVVAEFVADKTGVFEYYCSVGKHRELGMAGKLVVSSE